VDAARQAFRRACETGLAGAPELTVVAADNWTRWTVSRQAWVETAEADNYLLRAAESLQRTQLAAAHRRDWLVALRGLGQEACYAAVRRGRSSDAVVRMERARAVLLSESLALAPQALARLPKPIRERYAAAVAAVTAAEQADAAGADRPAG
jgi:hypothetical protein